MNHPSIYSLSIATFCDIRFGEQLLVVRNRSRFQKTGETVYGAIGGGVTVPGGMLQLALTALSDYSPSPERSASADGLTDLRFSLGSPAVGDKSISDLQTIAETLIADTVPPENLSPLTELRQELVDEEGVLSEEDLEWAKLQGTPRFRGSYTGDNRNDPGKERLYCVVGASVALPESTVEKIAERVTRMPDILRLVKISDIQRLIESGLLTPPTGVLVRS